MKTDRSKFFEAPGLCGERRLRRLPPRPLVEAPCLRPSCRRPPGSRICFLIECWIFVFGIQGPGGLLEISGGLASGHLRRPAVVRG